MRASVRSASRQFQMRRDHTGALRVMGAAVLVARLAFLLGALRGPDA